MASPAAARHPLFNMLLLFTSALLWSLGGVLIKGIDWNPMAIAGVRSLVAALTLLALGRRMRLTGSFWQIAGGVSYAALMILFVVANKLTTAANAIILQYTAPIYVAILAPWVLGERSHPRDWVVVFVVLGGMALFFFDQLTLSGLWGNLAAVASGVAFAAMALCLRKQKDGSALESIIIGNVIAAVAGAPFLRGPFPASSGWGLLVLMGVVQLGVPYLLYAWAVTRVTAMEACLLPMIEPILNPIWVLLVFGERPGTLSLIGGGIVLAAITVRSVLVTLDNRAASARERQRGARIPT